MRLDVNSSGSRPATDADKSAGVGRAAAIYAKKQAAGPGVNPMGNGSPEHTPNVSPMGQLLRDLHGLKSNDPHAFSKVTATIATRLQDIADHEPDDVADRLHRLAERFSQASQTGNLAALRPIPQSPVRGLHGAAAYAQASEHDRGKLQQEVQSAVEEVLSQYQADAPHLPQMPEPAARVTADAAGDVTGEVRVPHKVQVSA